MVIPSANDLKSLVSALAPGLIILGIRQRFLAAPEPSLMDRAISYAGVSAIYYAVVHPLLWFAHVRFDMPEWASTSLEYVGIPAAFGAIAAVEAHKQWTDRLWRRFGAQPVHPDPTAWDHLFFRRVNGDHYVIVTLTDGSTVAGRHTFASSSNAERDLLIDEVWRIDDQNQWSLPDDPVSILLCGKDIRFVEVIKGRKNDEQQATTAADPAAQHADEGVGVGSPSESAGGLPGADWKSDASTNDRNQRQATPEEGLEKP